MIPFAPRFTITHAITIGLTAIERARGFLEAATLSEAWITRMSEQALLLEAHHTTHIEGTQLSLAEAQQLWEGHDVRGARPDDVRELLNYRGAFQLVSEYLTSGDPITEGLIREIHKRLVDGVRGGSALPGVYRGLQNYVVSSKTGEVIYTPPPPESVRPLMQELVAWLRDDDLAIHPVLVAGIAQFQLVHIHPFMDGNGRTSRLLSTLCLYRAGYDFKRLFTLSELYDRDRAAFYRAIQGVRDAGMDLTGWLEFFVAGLATQLDEVKARGTAIIRRDAVVAEHRLNERQAAAVGYLLEHAELSIRTLEELCAGVSRRTLQRDMAALETAGLVLREGETNRLLYRRTKKL